MLRKRLGYEESGRDRLAIENRIAHAERRLQLAVERDEIAATRPEGCWCLGLGGGRRTTAYSVEIFIDTCGCPAGLREATRQYEVITNARGLVESQRVDWLWSQAGIPDRFRGLRVESWPSGKKHPGILRKLEPSDRSLVFYGPFGRGKTGLAVGYAWRCVHDADLKIKQLRFTTVPDMLAELRSTYNHPTHEDTLSEEEVIAKYARVRLLILDDLGAEQVKNTGWVEDRLYQIIGERHSELRPTIFTSNLNMDELAARIGDRVTWRIAEMVGKDNFIDMGACPNLR